MTATSSRQSTSRGQARQTDCRAVSSASVAAPAASAATSAALPATGVRRVGRVVRPAGARRHERPPARRQTRDRGHYGTSDQAMPSRMSCSLTSTSAKPNRVMIRSRMSAPAPITSTRPGMHDAGWPPARRGSWRAARRRSRAPGRRIPASGGCGRSRTRQGRARSPATVVTDPARPTSVLAFADRDRGGRLARARRRCPRSRRRSRAGRGGSPCRCRSVSRTQPMFTDRPTTCPPARAASGPPRTNSVEPPPMSVTR